MMKVVRNFLRAAAPVALGLLSATAGCQQPTQSFNTASTEKKGNFHDDPPVVSNIVRVNKFYSQQPWLSFDQDGSGNIDGFKCSVYLESPEYKKGVFGTGTIVASLYRVTFDPTGREVATPVQEWELSAEKSLPWRARQPTLLGWGYGLRLQWDKKQDLAGQEISIVIKYIRDDGRVIGSKRQVLRVPSKGNSAMTMTPPEEAAPPAPKKTVKSISIKK